MMRSVASGLAVILGGWFAYTAFAVWRGPLVDPVLAPYASRLVIFGGRAYEPTHVAIVLATAALLLLVGGVYGLLK